MSIVGHPKMRTAAASVPIHSTSASSSHSSKACSWMVCSTKRRCSSDAGASRWRLHASCSSVCPRAQRPSVPRDAPSPAVSTACRLSSLSSISMDIGEGGGDSSADGGGAVGAGVRGVAGESRGSDGDPREDFPPPPSIEMAGSESVVTPSTLDAMDALAISCAA